MLKQHCNLYNQSTFWAVSLAGNSYTWPLRNHHRVCTEHIQRTYYTYFGTVHSLLIIREVLILTVWILIALLGCISWCIPWAGSMMREWPQEISWFSGMYHPIDPSSWPWYVYNIFRNGFFDDITFQRSSWGWSFVSNKKCIVHSTMSS